MAITKVTNYIKNKECLNNSPSKIQVIRTLPEPKIVEYQPRNKIKVITQSQKIEEKPPLLKLHILYNNIQIDTAFIEDYNPIIDSNTILKSDAIKSPLDTYLLLRNYLSEFKTEFEKNKVKENLNIKDPENYISPELHPYYREIHNITNVKEALDDLYTLGFGGGGSNNPLDHPYTHINSKATNVKEALDELYELEIKELSADKVKYLFEGQDYNTVKDALDIINDKLFYKLPEALNVSFSAHYYRNDVEITTAYKGMIINLSIYNWLIHNYKNNISQISIDNKTVTGTSYIDNTPITLTTSKTLKVISNYLDSKGNSPAAYTGTCTLRFYDRLFYWTDIKADINHISSEKTLITGNQFNITTSSEEYIYLLFPSKKTWIHIYELGGVDPGGIVTEYINSISYTEFDNSITYYLYKSINALKGKWTIKYL